jgi:hypothetical protein
MKRASHALGALVDTRGLAVYGMAVDRAFALVE